MTKNFLNKKMPLPWKSRLSATDTLQIQQMLMLCLDISSPDFNGSNQYYSIKSVEKVHNHRGTAEVLLWSAVVCSSLYFPLRFHLDQAGGFRQINSSVC